MSRLVSPALARRLTALGARDRRALLLGGLALVSALGFRLVVLPYAGALAEVREQVDRERDLLRREVTLVAEAGSYRTRFDRSEQALLREAPRLFAGPDLTAATGALSAYVNELAVRHRVFVQQSETRSPEAAEDGVEKVRVDLRAVGDLEGLLSLLRSLESPEEGAKLVAVERLLVTPAERITAGEPRDEEVLGISATVAGYVLADVGGQERTPPE